MKDSTLGVEKIFFSGSEIEFVCDRVDKFLGEVIEIGTFKDVLPDEFVHVLDRSFLSTAIRIGEIHDDIS